MWRKCEFTYMSLFCGILTESVKEHNTAVGQPPLRGMNSLTEAVQVTWIVLTVCEHTDIINLIDISEEWGLLPVWPLCGLLMILIKGLRRNKIHSTCAWDHCVVQFSVSSQFCAVIRFNKSRIKSFVRASERRPPSQCSNNTRFAIFKRL